MKTTGFLRVGLFTGILSFLAAGPAPGQGAPSVARIWDSTIKIAPGAYRAAKPIELNGQIEITASPWTMIDGITFNGTKANQSWHLDGTIMRRVNLSGQLGISLEAKNSVFEDCGLSKTGGWFVDMWGSHWQFDNCIFTKKFMRADLPVGDYSVHAAYCTFYDIKLPTIGVKGDPGTYLQKDNMAFIKCLFSRCAVPESFLAATVDCVFEDCQFSSKRQEWPKEMSSIKVAATFTGLTEGPKSFLNGPLSARFTEAPLKPDAGTRLAHSKIGSGITLAGYNPPLQYANFGTSPKRSSEIMPSTANPTNVPFAKPAVPAARPPAGAVDVHSFQDLVRSLPPVFHLITDGQPNIDGIDAANKWLNDHFAGHKAALQTQYHAGTAINDSGDAYRVMGSDEAILYRGATLTAHSVSLFSAESAKLLPGLPHGAQVKIAGVIKNVEIQGVGHDLVLIVTIANASLQ